MNPLVIEEVHKLLQSSFQLIIILIIPQEHPFVLKCPPCSLDSRVILAATYSIHTDENTKTVQIGCKLDRCVLTSGIGIEDGWDTISDHSFHKSIQAEPDIHGAGQS